LPRVLLTGGTGFLGGRIGALLKKEGFIINHLSRGRPAEIMTSDQWISGDIRDPEACNRAAKGTCVAIHAAGEKVHEGIMYAVNVEGTNNLLHASLRNKVGLFIYISSVGVIGAPPLKKKKWDEDAECRPSNTYEYSKWQGEQKVREASVRGLTTVILRPTNVFGDRDSSKGLLSLLRNVRDGRFIFIGGRNCACNFIFVDDVAHAVLSVIKSAKAPFTIRHVADPCKIGEFVDAIADNLGVKRPRLVMPYLFAELMRTVLCPLSRLSSVSRSAIYSRWTTLNNQAIFISKLLNDQSDFAHTVGWHQGVKRLVHWYRCRGEL